MKRLIEFVYVIHYAARARLTGGRNYQIHVWQNKGPGKLVSVGTGSACTASHCGEDSEAWQVIVRAMPRILRRFPAKGFTNASYFSWSEGETARVKMTRLYVVS